MPIAQTADADEQSWCYVHVHYKQVDRMEKDCHIFADAPDECFVHKTIITIAQKKDKHITQTQQERQTISGLVFFRGTPQAVQAYLTAHYNHTHLVKDRATGAPAVIPDKQMRPFMQMASYAPSLVRIIDAPISTYARGHKLVRLLTGILRGHEGYIVRKAGDRKFFMPFGSRSLSISNIHKEAFEEV